MPIKVEKSLAKEHPIMSYINSTYFAFEKNYLKYGNRFIKLI